MVPKRKDHTNQTNSSSGDGDGNKDDDELIIQVAEEHFREERLLEAVRVLCNLQDRRNITPQLREVVEKADRITKMVVDLKSEPGSEWIKQGENHGKWDTMLYYKIDNSSHLTARIETPIEPGLLNPLLSVLNETSLYETWIPSWKRPFTLGVRECKPLRHTGRVAQLVKVVVDAPWPMASREVVLDAVAIDEIEANGSIAVHIEPGDPHNPDVPPVEQGLVRIAYRGGFLFRKCPSNHPVFLHSKHKPSASNTKNMILVCAKMFVDSKVNFIPQALQNFVTRTVLGRIWEMLLQVAQDVQDGKRPQHAALIERKRELYNWVDRRVGIMLHGMDANDEVDQREDVSEAEAADLKAYHQVGIM